MSEDGTRLALELEHGDVVAMGVGERWSGQVIGTHDTVGDEVMVVMIVPAEVTFALIEEGVV